MYSSDLRLNFRYLTHLLVNQSPTADVRRVREHEVIPADSLLYQVHMSALQAYRSKSSKHEHHSYWYECRIERWHLTQAPLEACNHDGYICTRKGNGMKEDLKRKKRASEMRLITR